MIRWLKWFVIRRARRQVEQIARQTCAVRVFSRQAASRTAPRRLAIWIATATDKDRDRLLQDSSLHDRLAHALIEVGYPADAVPRVRFVVQSQETVDREYGGNWAEAAEMP